MLNSSGELTSTKMPHSKQTSPKRRSFLILNKGILGLVHTQKTQAALNSFTHPISLGEKANVMEKAYDGRAMAVLVGGQLEWNTLSTIKPAAVLLCTLKYNLLYIASYCSLHLPMNSHFSQLSMTARLQGGETVFLLISTLVCTSLPPDSHTTFPNSLTLPTYRTQDSKIKRLQSMYNILRQWSPAVLPAAEKQELITKRPKAR